MTYFAVDVSLDTTYDFVTEAVAVSTWRSRRAASVAKSRQRVANDLIATVTASTGVVSISSLDNY